MTDTIIPISEVLYRAADLIERRGWATGSKSWGHESRGAAVPLCIEGAIAVAIGRVANGLPSQGGIWPEELNACPAASAVHDYLDRRFTYLYQFNDAIRRTADEVIEVLRAAAVIEAAKEQAAVDTPAVSVAPVRSGL